MVTPPKNDRARPAAPAAAPGRRAAVAVRASTASTAELQKKFGIKGNVEFVDGKAGSPTVVLKHSCGSSAQVRSRFGSGFGLVACFEEVFCF